MKTCFGGLATFVLIASTPVVYGQKWEVGAGVGGSFYTSQDITNAAASAKAGMSNGLAASLWLGNNSGNLLGGEIRYDYEHTDLKLSGGGQSASFGANTQAVHYDFLLHFTPRSSRIRPFVAAGGGVKFYRGTGRESAFQPLSSLALLTQTTDTKPLVSVGGGVKVSFAHALQLRLEVHDYLTPFPTKVIAPVPGVKLGGWLQDFVAMAALAFTFGGGL